jgi:hypothetical protein
MIKSQATKTKITQKKKAWSKGKQITMWRTYKEVQSN